MNVRITRREAVLAGMLDLVLPSAMAQDYPARPVTIVHPYPAGGVADIFARLLATDLSKRFGQAFIVDAKPGGTYTIGMRAVKRAPPDGYTLLLHTNALTLVQSTLKNSGLDVRTDYEPVSMLGQGQFGLFVQASVPVKTVQELIAYAKRNPGKLNYGSAGTGSATHLVTARMAHLAGIDMVHVPYAGGPALLQAFMRNDIQVLVWDSAAVLRQNKDSQFTMLAAMGSQRWSAAPAIPTLKKEAGIDQESSSYLALLAPAGTPVAIAERLNAAVKQALNSPRSRPGSPACRGRRPGARVRSSSGRSNRKWICGPTRSSPRTSSSPANWPNTEGKRMKATRMKATRMKKQGIFLSAALLCGTAMASDSLQLFGAVDTGVTYGHGGISDRTQLTQSNNAVSKLGLRGSESLGGGLSASFFLEGSIQSDSGAGVATSSNNQPLVGAPAASPGGQGFTFNRRATVSLTGKFGEVRLGRDVTPQYWNTVFADPFGHLGVGASQLLGSNRAGPAFERVSNSIHYFTPQAGGFFAHAAYYLGENPGGTATEDDGTGAALRVGYTTGPWSVSAAAARTSYASGDIGTQSLLGIWQGTSLKLMALVHRDTNSSAVPGGRGWQLSAVQAVRTGEIRASVSSYRSDVVANPGTSKLALGYVHNLSKRSALYATVAHLRNRGGASAALGGAVTGANGRSSGIDLGVRHLF